MREGYEKCELGNDLEFVDELILEMILILVDYASDKFWKVLKYGSTDALTNPSYTVSRQDKYDMIKPNNVVVNSEGETISITKVRRNKYNNDISTVAHSEIRLFDGSWNAQSQNDYSLLIGLEVISHNKSMILDGTGESTINILRHELYKIFNNSYVYKSVGKMTNVGVRGAINVFNESYQGYQFGLKTTSA